MKINIINLFRIADIFVEKPLGNKTQANSQKLQENKILNQIKAFVDKLKHSGTIDSIISFGLKMFTGFKNEDIKQFNLPELKNK